MAMSVKAFPDITIAQDRNNQITFTRRERQSRGDNDRNIVTTVGRLRFALDYNIIHYTYHVSVTEFCRLGHKC